MGRTHDFVAGWTRRSPDQRWYRVAVGKRDEVMEALAKFGRVERLITDAAIDANRSVTGNRIIPRQRGDREG